ncbi:uncharacterized protein LOC111359145 [Spodoptera litura]|uniref:Uncharacterized protein LOC111359145 n=1 Tax=Spodoptera litura TaxID=69820 RepID=A0A9J7EKU0_SPOLT|nr:uncharacterized protein LOC111359145 [Spodoptera litura]
MFVQKILFLVAHISGIHTAEDQITDNPSTDTNFLGLRNISGRMQYPQQEWTFENYVKKFEPATIWERIDRKKRYEGVNITEEEQSEMMLEGIDTFDEIMNMKIENGNPKLILERDGRRGWKSNTAGTPFNMNDRFFLRRRLYELMKQVIYQTRNKMIVTQFSRDLHKNSSLYKMGFLMSKVDNLIKIYSMFSLRALRGCTLHVEWIFNRYPTYDMLNANERQLSLLFNIELLVELLRRNDKTCRRIFKKHKLNRKDHFDAEFED